MLAHLLDVVFVDQIGRQHAGRVARMDSRILDVLHHATDDYAFAVRDRVDIRLESVLEESVDQNGFVFGDLRRALEILRQRRLVVDDFHGAPTQYVRRTHQYRVSDSLGGFHRFLEAGGGPVFRLSDLQPSRDRVEPSSIFRDVDCIGLRAEDPNGGLGETARQLERRLTPELDDHSQRLFALDDVEHVLEAQRLEVKLVGDVEIGGDGFRVRVDHDRLVTLFAQRQRSAHTAVIELHSLTDSIWPAAEDDDGWPPRFRRFTLFVVAAVQVRGGRRKFAGAGIDHLVRGDDPKPNPARAGGAFGFSAQISELLVGKSHPLHAPERILVDDRERGEGFFGLEQLRHLCQKPRIYARKLIDVVDGQPRQESALYLENSLGGRLPKRCAERLQRAVDEAVVHQRRRDRPARAANLERAQGFLERFLERAPDRHRFADGFHLRREPRVRGAEFLEGKARTLHDDIVENRLERRRCGAGDVVGNLIEPITNRELRPGAGDRKSGRLRCQRRRSRYARIHLDHQHLAVARVDRELDVATACFDPNLPNDGDGSIAHQLVFAIGECHRRRDGDRIAGVNAHRVDVLDRADDNDIVGAVAHHLELELLPADDAALDQHLTHRRQIESAADGLLEFLPVVSDAATRPAECESGTDYRRERSFFENLERLVESGSDPALRHGETDPFHRFTKKLAILRHRDRPRVRSDQLDAVFVQHSTLGQFHRHVECSLPAHRRQQRVGFFLGDHQLDVLGRHRLNVGTIRKLRVRHDRGRIRVNQNDLESFFLERLGGLSARIVEFRALTDDYRAGADYENSFDIGALRHCVGKYLRGDSGRTKEHSWRCSGAVPI